MLRYIKSLDGIRGFGIFFILCFHYLRLNDYHPTTLGFGPIWIQMFFVQSGYLITVTLLQSKSQPFSDYAAHFYWRRMLRIFPVYFGYLLVFAALYLLFKKPDDFGDRAPYLFTFTYNYTRLLPDIEFSNVWFVHLWYMSVEVQFYLIWPVLVYFLEAKRIRVLIVSIIILVPVFRFFFTDFILSAGYSAEMAGEITYAFTVSQFDAFMMGAAIPFFNLTDKIRKPGKLALGALAIVLIAGFSNYYLLVKDGIDISITSLGYSVGMINNLQHVWSYTLLNLLFVLVVLYLVREDYTGVFNNGILVNIGKIVYGIYIYHFVILFAFSRIDRKLIHSFPISFVLACIVTCIISYLSYNYFEKRFLKYLNHWNTKSKQSKS